MTRLLIRIFGVALLLLAGLVGPSSLPAQDSPKQDIKDAGHETKEAAKDTGRAVKNGTHKAADKTEEAQER
jgi:hypothetical protein